jgi:hypothetical protein
MAKLILSAGKKIEVRPEVRSFFTIGELQKLVQGSLEVVDLRQGFLLVFNPEQPAARLNLAATKIANKEVRGTAVLVSYPEMGV